MEPLLCWLLSWAVANWAAHGYGVFALARMQRCNLRSQFYLKTQSCFVVLFAASLGNE